MECGLSHEIITLDQFHTKLAIHYVCFLLEVRILCFLHYNIQCVLLQCSNIIKIANNIIYMYTVHNDEPHKSDKIDNIFYWILSSNNLSRA